MEITAVFGSNVFSDKVMKERLPKDAYKALKESIEKDVPLRPEIAEVVASAMRDWAVGKGATHYTHWFQPLTGSPRKSTTLHLPRPPTEAVTWNFPASSSSRASPTHRRSERRPAQHLRGQRVHRLGLHIPGFPERGCERQCHPHHPTAFYSYNGEALDKKTPLLRSMKAVVKQA
jgi:glutamine synthetase